MQLRSLTAIVVLFASACGKKTAPPPSPTAAEVQSHVDRAVAAEAELKQAEAAAAAARKAADDAQARTDVLEKQLAEQQRKIDKAVEAIATPDPGIAAAQARLADLQKQEAEMKAEAEAAKQSAEKR